VLIALSSVCRSTELSMSNDGMAVSLQLRDNSG
jgi:hypothetical protein